MPFLHRVSASLDPSQAAIAPEEATVRVFRLTLLMTSALLLPFGWLYHASGVARLDPMALRVAGTVLSVALLAGTYTVPWVQRHAFQLMQATSYLVLVYFGGLAYVNHLAPGYGVGFLFAFSALSLAHTLTFSKRPCFHVLLGVAVSLTLAVTAAVPDPEVPRAVFALCTLSLAVLFYVALGARMALVDALTRSRAHLDDAQAMAEMGSWEMDFHTMEVVWSAGMHRLIGAPRSERPSVDGFLDHVHEADRATVVDTSSLQGPSASDEVRVRFRPRGASGWRRVIIRRTMERHPDGLPASVFGTVQDITEHHDREVALREALARAEEAARAKSEFLANMSHEIRTPLTSIIGFAQLLREDLGDGHADYADLVGPIEAGGQRLLATLNSVLDLARMDAGQSDLRCEAVDAGAEAEAVARMLAPLGAAKGLDVQVVRPDAPVLAHADRAALSRILTNLAANAVKFTDAGQVTLAVATDGGDALLTVHDTGRGMDAAFLTELFEPFRQASTGWARSHEGTGLGLTIVKQLCEAMQGSVQVASEPGRGTTFSVRLPLADAEADANPDAEAVPDAMPARPGPHGAPQAEAAVAVA